ncbi:hypothetical protein DYB37_008059 [Aphanomyces astaci]|uniref:Enoyl reductase (ER) domain-containing protein n=2 Tax=Aphanomyces astaci TaxID=112090 RepID=A0A397F8N5_APHAT|nr:hypothetical protein DYB36_007316 [Aphanomyces astaci]RHY00951.1 hypothetical protein DYB25_009555 [Aphanomyces astaci]RHY39708.1 hypothetical protein DYB38_003208 [Aphanomyces astaci]RHY50754.1 hypothetical protein DYB34_010600 [Aphanomyces astaci]RHY58734.1 hypothetical protein DYB30_005204 [Aphanomyces astaci]
MASNDIYHGQAAFAPGLDVRPHEYAAKPFDDEYDVEIKVTHCGICGSDLHTITGGWGKIAYPLVVGHEIIGHVTRVGSKVDTAKYPIGARVGVGAQCGSCLDCNQCNRQLENLCDNNVVYTYNSSSNGYITQGGYADYYRCHFNFVVPIPDGITSESAAPMMCAGVTTYAPLKHHGAGPGKHVGVVGIGGLGHLGVQWAVALGAEVTALSSSSKKEHEAKDLLGAHHFLNYSDASAVTAAAKSYDILLVTSYGKDTNWNVLLSLVATNGKLVLVGLPEAPVSFFPFSVVSRQVTFVGSTIGSPAELEEMLAFAVEKRVNSIVQVVPMSRATDALHQVRNGDVRFRIVLKNE